MGLDLTTFDAALKQYYTKERVINQVYADNPLFALMPKSEEFYGRNLPIVTIFGNPQSRSASFTRAQIRSSHVSTRLDDFLLTRVKDYAVAEIDGETMQATQNDMGAFLEAATVEIDGAMHELVRSISVDLYREGLGIRGQVGTSTTLASTTLVLSNPLDAVNFEVGMELDVFTTKTGASKAYGTSGNGLIVTGVNVSAGTLTFGFNLNDATNGIPTIAHNDFIAVRGDHSGATLVKLAGLEAWIPTDSPGATPFFGVVRNVHPSRLAGQRLVATGAPIIEALYEASAIVAREGGKLTHFFMNFEKFTELQNSLGSKVQYVDLKVTAEIGFRGITINGARGPIACVPDHNCPPDKIYGLCLDVWKLYSLGPVPQFLEHDGLMLLRKGSSDAVEARMGFYGNLGCRAPGWNINITI